MQGTQLSHWGSVSHFEWCGHQHFLLDFYIHESWQNLLVARVLSGFGSESEHKRTRVVAWCRVSNQDLYSCVDSVDNSSVPALGTIIVCQFG